MNESLWRFVPYYGLFYCLHFRLQTENLSSAVEEIHALKSESVAASSETVRKLQAKQRELEELLIQARVENEIRVSDMSTKDQQVSDTCLELSFAIDLL
jgi:hypothetical protein